MTKFKKTLSLKIKKPEDILRNQKYLYLPEGSVLIPFLQTSPSPVLREIFKETNDGNKASSYFYFLIHISV